MHGAPRALSDADLASSSWDVIVVGAGSAGATFAARLAGYGGRKVLLLEAGPDLGAGEAPAALHDANGYAMVADERYVWPDVAARVTDLREPEPFYVARIVGGGSAINGQGAVRPLAEDFEAWAAAGCSGWSPAELLPVLERLESDLDFPGLDGHGKDGPVPVWRPPAESWNPVDRAFEEAARAAGHAAIADVNAPGAEGVGAFPANRRGGLRYSAALAHLEPLRGRRELAIAANSVAHRVVIEERRARGVELERAGRSLVVRGGEVVLCAGAVFSPTLLWRSGVGPAAALRRLGIPRVVDLPVGQHLLEHPIAFLTLRLREPARVSSRDVRTTSACARYSSGRAGCGRGDMWLWGMGSAGATGSLAQLGLLGASVFQSFSEGDVTLASAAPGAAPLVRLGLLSDERDRERLLDGVERLIGLAQHPAFGRIVSRWELRGLWDGSGRRPSRAALCRWLLDSCRPAFHVAGSCRMGAEDDVLAVVDPLARVRGVEGLRVADASIMPCHVRANPHLTAVAIGERVADLVRSRAGS